MISGFALLADGATRSLDSLEGLRDAWACEGSVVWADLEAPREADVCELGAILGLDEAALEDCRCGEQRPRIDEFEGYLFLVLYGMLGLVEDAFAPRKLAAFLGPRFVITIHREPLRTIKSINDRCARNPAKTLGEGADAVLYRIIDEMVDNYLYVGEQHEQCLEALEDQSLSSDVDEGVLTAAGDLRKALLELRRLAASQRELITPLSKGEYNSIADSLEGRFRHVADHLSHVIDVTDATRERLNSIRDNYHAALANRANATMQRLTIVATILLPMSVIAGIYGMNVPVWPSSDNPLSFWMVISAMAIISGALLAYFRWMRWF